MRENRYRLSSLAIFMSSACMVMAADPNDGELDANWNGSGMATSAFNEGGENMDHGWSVVVAPDGSTFTAGLVINGYVIEPNLRHIGVTKKLPSGTPDTLFGTNGKSLSPVTDIELGPPIKAVLTRQGNEDWVLVVATRRVSATNTHFVICRVHAGSGQFVAFPAPNSPINGCATDRQPIQFSGQRVAADILVQPDGKFIVGGTYASVDMPTQKYAYVVRFNPDGSRDNSFASSALRNDVAFESHEVKAIALADDGKIVVAGATKRPFQSGLDALVMRLNADGTQDPVGPEKEAFFDLDGHANRSTEFTDLVLEKDPDTSNEAIIAAGYAELATDNYSGLIARIIGDNPVSLDMNFGTSPGYSLQSAPSPGMAFVSVASHPCAGHIVVGDLHSAVDSIMFAMAWSRAGNVNFSFGSLLGGGATGIDVYPGFDQSNSAKHVTVSGNGVYAAGTTFSPFGSDYDFAVAKLFMDSLFCDRFGGYLGN